MLTKRQSHPALPVLVLFLCGAVFAWGILPRLSKLRTPSHIHKTWSSHLFQDDQADKKRGELDPCVRLSRFKSFVSKENFSFQPRPVVYRSLAPSRLAASFLPPHPHVIYSKPPPSNA